ncbi:MAG: hypothetical protein HY928_06245 [Elusimicrobia bacterium]|nr:hypothetical protein [Elusimicrobiota bacterium]
MDESPRRFAGPAVFLALLALLGADLARVSFIESHWDEDACIAIGWLLSKGWRLYGDVFSHHMPLDYIPSWAISSFFGTGFVLFRGFMLILWAAVCSALYLVSRRQEPGPARAVPFVYVVLSSQWLTYWMGHLMLVESYWGYAVVLLLALIGTPLGFRRESVHRAEPVLVGALLGLVLSASLTCALPFACLAAWLAHDPDWRPRWRGVAVGFLAWLVVFGLWCLRYVGWSQWYTQAFWFNANVYAAFYPFDVANPYFGFLLQAVKDNASYFAAALSWSDLGQYFEGLLRLAVLGWVLWNALQRRFFAALWWVLFTVCIRARAERFAYAPPFHATPFFLTAVLLLSAGAARAWYAVRGRGLRPALGAMTLAALLFAPTLLTTSMATAALKPFGGDNRKYEMLLGAVRACTAPDDRLAVFPCYPRFYTDSGRLPATPNVFYLPWQEAWEPQRTATLRGLEQSKPKVVIIQDTTIWGIPWKKYGGAVEEWVAGRYVPVVRGTDPEEDLRVQMFVLKEHAAEFVLCAGRLGAPSD